MEVSLIIIGALVVVGLPLYLLHRRDVARGGYESAPVQQPGRPDGCCGQHEVCEKDSLLVDSSQPPEYFDDEELDRFIGRSPDDYTDGEIEEFNEVLLTLRPDEVAAWARSLQARHIEPPADVRDELLLIIGESRQNDSQR